MARTAVVFGVIVSIVVLAFLFAMLGIDMGLNAIEAYQVGERFWAVVYGAISLMVVGTFIGGAAHKS